MGFSNITRALGKALEAEASNRDLVLYEGCLTHLCIFCGVQHKALTQLGSFIAGQINKFLLNTNGIMIICYMLESPVNL